MTQPSMGLTIKAHARTANKLGQRERRAPSYLTWRDGFELSDDLYRRTLKVAKGARRYQAKNGTTKTRVLYLFIRRSDGPDILANLHTANWEKGEERARPIVRKAIAAGCLPADHGAALHYAPKRKATRPVCVMVDRRIGQGKYLLKALKLDGSFGYICLDVEEGEPDAWELVKDRSRVVVADWLGRELISPNLKPAKTYGPGGLDADFATEARRLAAQKWFAEKCRVESGRATRYGANVEPFSKRPPVDRAARLAKISEIADLPAPKRAAACEVAVQLGLGDREAVAAMLELELVRRGNAVPLQAVTASSTEPWAIKREACTEWMIKEMRLSPTRNPYGTTRGLINEARHRFRLSRKLAEGCYLLALKTVPNCAWSSPGPRGPHPK